MCEWEWAWAAPTNLLYFLFWHIFLSVTKCEPGTKRCQRWYTQWNRAYCSPNMLCFGDRLCECVGADTENHISFKDFQAPVHSPFSQSLSATSYIEKCGHIFSAQTASKIIGKKPSSLSSNRTHTFCECDLTSSCAAQTQVRTVYNMEPTVTCV